MKRKGYLYEKIISIDNLYLASQNAEKTKRKHPEVIVWNEDFENNIWNLHKELRDEKYRVPPYTIFKIFEPKERIISKLPYKDRVVHHAILNIIEPILKASFISQSYSCIKGRGIHRCLKDVKSTLKNKDDTIFCLKFDIAKFYPSIDNEILKKSLLRKFKDVHLLKLLDLIIDSCKGLPLGNFTSQWFANYYMNGFDHWIKEQKRIKYYFRYCDDMVILSNDKQFLHGLRKDIQRYLKDYLKLNLSNYQVFPVESRGIDFVGYRMYHSHVMLRKSIKNRFKIMLRKYPNKKSIASYKGWTKHANCRNLENKYLNG